MKKCIGVLLFLAVLPPSLHPQKTRFGQGLPYAKPGVDYPVKIHVSGVRVRSEWDQAQESGRVLTAEATLEGKKVELTGATQLNRDFYRVPVLPGDYQARFLKNPHEVNGTPFYREYELLLPDRTVWRCTVTGVFE